MAKARPRSNSPKVVDSTGQTVRSGKDILAARARYPEWRARTETLLRKLRLEPFYTQLRAAEAKARMTRRPEDMKDLIKRFYEMAGRLNLAVRESSRKLAGAKPNKDLNQEIRTGRVNARKVKKVEEFRGVFWAVVSRRWPLFSALRQTIPTICQDYGAAIESDSIDRLDDAARAAVIAATVESDADDDQNGGDDARAARPT